MLVSKPAGSAGGQKLLDAKRVFVVGGAVVALEDGHAVHLGLDHLFEVELDEIARLERQQPFQALGGQVAGVGLYPLNVIQRPPELQQLLELATQLEDGGFAFLVEQVEAVTSGQGRGGVMAPKAFAPNTSESSVVANSP